MQKITSLGIGILVFGIAAGLAIGQSQRNPHAPPTSTTTNDEISSDTRMRGYTLLQVAEHADVASCWTTVNGSVYDLSAWIGQHPGGEKNILDLCGKDGSAAFSAQHGAATKPENILASYKIGVLAQ